MTLIFFDFSREIAPCHSVVLAGFHLGWRIAQAGRTKQKFTMEGNFMKFLDGSQEFGHSSKVCLIKSKGETPGLYDAGRGSLNL
jgi:hypothetical protein